MKIKEVKNPGSVASVAALAHEIWNEHYTPIIGKKQVDYMLTKFQSKRTITVQIKDGYRYFLIIDGREYAGYFAVLPEPVGKRMYLSKFYLKKSMRGRGLSKYALNFIEKLSRENGINVIWLTVNKHNPSVNIYKSLGFKKKGVVVTDIGGGFVMDDFRMEKYISIQ
jgi:diamine N-acetyltransferase